MTKRAIITLILNELGKPFDHELYQRIGDRVLALRAKYLRQSIAKYGLDELLKQTTELKLEKKYDDNNCIYYQSVCKVPIPIRVSQTSAPFNFVGTVTGVPFTFLRPFEIRTIPAIPINKLNKYYTVENNYIITYNTSYKKIKLTDIFEDLDDLIDCHKTECVDDDTELPTPADMIDLIVKDLVSELGQLNQISNDETVKE